MANRHHEAEPGQSFELEDDGFLEGEKTTVAPAPVMFLDEPDFGDQSEPGPSPEEAELLRARLASLSSLSLEKRSVVLAEKRASRLPWVLLVVFVLGGSAYHFTVVGSMQESTPAAIEKIEIQPSRAAAHPSSSLLAAGYIAARVPITVGVTTSGRVREVKVANGDPIERGQILAILEDGQLQAELSLARAKERDAQRALNRIRKLVRAQAGTARELDRAQGMVEIARAERRVIAERLEQTRIRAPIDGTVLEVLTHPGEVLTVAPEVVAGVVRVADLKDLVAEVDVNEADISRVRVGQAAEVASDAQPQPQYTGRVREIAQQADRARGTVLVKVDLENVQDGALKPGMAVKVRFLEAR